MAKGNLVNTNPDISAHFFSKNHFFPNSKLPVLIYSDVCYLGKQKYRAARHAQELFRKHNWKNSWSNGIYTFHHYHSNTHECMAIILGRVLVIIGGPAGKRLWLKKGDVIIIPAGVAHKCSKASEDFFCVGAYPSGKEYDINHGLAEEYEKAAARIAKLPKPALDPLFGKEGFLKSYWNK